MQAGISLEQYPRLRFALRISWILVRLLLVFWLGQQGSYFYYQGF